MLLAQRPSLGEAHGGYTFCALASWVLLQPYLSTNEAPRVNIPQLIRWLVNMQGIESELGGFRGRTNKLVDGCYSWWVGGAFPLLEALGVSPGVPESVHAKDEASHVNESAENIWDDVDGAPRVTVYHPETMLAYGESDSLFDRRALQEYILLAGQHPAGGLRDKPPKCVRPFSKSIFLCVHVAYRNPDAYHTSYCLSGLSAAQHPIHPSPTRRKELREAWKGEDGMRSTAFSEALCWTEESGSSRVLGSAANRVVCRPRPSR